MKNIIMSILVCLALFFSAGCSSLLGSGKEMECEDPAVAVTDINGNIVCVLASPSDLEDLENIGSGQDKGLVNESVSDEIIISEDDNRTAAEIVEGMRDAAGIEEEDMILDIEDIVDATGDGLYANQDSSFENESGYDLPVKEVYEGELVNFPNLDAYDPDGDELFYTFSEPLNEQGEWKTQVGDAGSYKVTISVSDGVHVTSQDVIIIVNKRNNPPVIEPMEDIIVEAGELVVLEPIVYDVDGDELIIEYSGWMNTSIYETTSDDVGNHTVTITVSDGVDIVSEEVMIIVREVNRPPVFSPDAFE